MTEPTQPDKVTAAFNALWADATLGPEVRRRVKALYPDVQIPEDTYDPLVAPLKAELEALKAERDAERKAAAEAAEAAAKEKAEREQATVQQNFEAAIANARQKYNLTDEGFDKMCERIKATGNYADADAAAAWVAQQTPPPAQAGPYLGPQQLNLYSPDGEHEERLKLLHRSPDKFLDAELRDFAADAAKYCAEAGFPYQ